MDTSDKKAGFRVRIVLSIVAGCLLGSTADSAQRPPYYTAWNYWYYDGWPGGGIYDSEADARAAITASFENTSGCPASLQTVGIWHWGSYSVSAHPAAYLSHGDHDYVLNYANDPPMCSNHVSRDVKLRKQRVFTPPVCDVGYNGPFEIEPAGPWYACRDDEQNFFQNPLTPDCPPTAGNPCELTTGAKVERVVDYSGPGIEFYRTYRSNLLANAADDNWPLLNGPHGVLGGNWIHSYSAAIVFTPSPYEITHLLRPDGTLVKLYEIEPGALVAENGSGLQVRGSGVLNYASDIVVHLPSGAREVYKWHRSSLNGPLRPYLKELHDPLGNVTTVYYKLDNLGNEITGVITSVVGPFGHTLQFEYASLYVPFGQSKFSLDYIVDPAGQKIDFIHDLDDVSTAGDRLRGAIYPDQHAVQYLYTDHTPGYVTSSDYFVRGIVDEHGHEFATFEYYDVETNQLDRRIKSTRHGDYEYTEISYAYTGESATVVDAAGNATVYQFQPTPGLDPHAAQPNWIARNPGVVGRPGGSFTAQVNENGGQRRILESADENGVVTRYEYDAYHLTRKLEGYDPGTGSFLRETTYEYLSETSGLETRVRRASVACPGKYSETVNSYLAGTQWVSSVTETGYAPADCDSAINRTTTYSDFNAFGQPRRIDGPRGVDSLVIEYHECQAGAECGQVRSITNALGHVTQYPEYDAHGRVTRTIDPNGVETTIAYTPRGHVASVTRVHGARSRTLEFDYDPAGLLESIRLPEGLTLDYAWNSAHLLESVTDGAGNRIDYSYDARGNRTDERLVDAAGSVTKSRVMAYDARNLLASIQAGANPAAQMTYDDGGNLVATTDPNSNRTSYRYGALNRLASTIDALNGAAKPTQYGYDMHDNLTSVTAPNGAFTVFVYDDFGNLLREDSPDRGITLYEYDAAGNLVCKADARITGGLDYGDCGTARSSGAAWVYTYDPLNRIDTIDYLDTVASPDVDYDYDTGAGHRGRLTSVLNATGIGQSVLTDYEYDAWGNRTAQIEIAPGRDGSVTNSVAFEYDGNDQLTRVTYPNGRIVRYVRNNGRVVRIVADSPFDGVSTTLMSAASYYPFGPPASVAYGNGRIQHRLLDTAHRPVELAISDSVAMVDSQTYSVDPAGNITTIADLFEPADTVYFEYDVLNRLVVDSRIDGDPLGATYIYDENGNRLSRNADLLGYSDQTITPLSLSNRQAAIGVSPVRYDPAGNALENGLGLRAFYDSANRLSSLSQNGVSTTHFYNGNGEIAKLIRVSNCGCTCQRTHEYFAFAPDGRALSHYSENRVRFSTDYVWLDGLPIAAIEERFGSDGAHLEGSTAITYLHADHLGTPLLGTDSAGVIVWENTPDAFGGAIISTAGPDIRLRFPGQFDYGVGGIYYNRFRDYDSAAGRYLESDPIGLIGGLNTYAYALNHPVINTDPLGLFDPRELLRNPRLREALQDPKIRGVLSLGAARLAELAAEDICHPIWRGLANLGAAGFSFASGVQFGIVALGSGAVVASAGSTGLGFPAAAGAAVIGTGAIIAAGYDAAETARFLEEATRSFGGESTCNESSSCSDGGE